MKKCWVESILVVVVVLTLCQVVMASEDSCLLYPIAVNANILSDAEVGDDIYDILNGGNHSQKGWLTWNGSQSANTLVQSLNNPGHCTEYINPENPDDHCVSVGDWVKGKSGTCNKRAVRNALDALVGQEIIVPVWNDFNGKYNISAFTRVKITGYSLNRNRISAQFLGYESCSQQNQAPVVDAGQDKEVYLPATLQIEGTVDDDSENITISWSLVDGPGTVAFSPEDAVITTVEFSTPGEYTLRLTANDGELESSDDIIVTVHEAQNCQLYPIALSAYSLNSANPGEVVTDIMNGGCWFWWHYGWLTWSGEQCPVKLYDSLTVPGNSQTYNNPYDETDHEVSTGDWVQSKLGTANYCFIKHALNELIGTEIVVPVWDQFTSCGYYGLYHVETFARVRIISYNLCWGMITAEFLGYTTCDDNENQSPVAIPQSVSIDEDTSINITLEGIDPDGDTLNFTTTDPSNGSLTGTPPNLAYTPNQDFNGTDSFTFTVSDGSVTSDPATIEIEVVAVNDAPIAIPQSIELEEDSSDDIVLSATDVDDPNLDYQIDIFPTNGVISGTLPTITYTPSIDFNGIDSFTFTASDSELTSAPVTIALTINAVNDTPIANEQSITTSEDQTLDIILTALDVDGDTVEYSVVDTPDNGFLNGTVPNLTYTPGANFNGSDSFSFEVTDGLATSTTATISITIDPVNDIPAANSQSVSTDEDISLNITLDGLDVDGDTLSFELTQQPLNGSLSGTLPDLIYTPNGNYNGTDSISFIVNDGTTNSSEAIITINVTSINDAPTATGNSYELDEDQTIDIVLFGNDVENDILTYIILTDASHGSLSGTAPDLTFTPNANYSGGDQIEYAVSDSSLTSASAIVSFIINPVNDQPVADSMTLDVNEDQSLDITLTGSDLDGDALDFYIDSSPANGTLTGTAPDLTYTPNSDFNGIDTFTYYVNDNTTNSEIATILINVASINDAPVASPQSVSIDEDISINITLTATDVDGDILAYSLIDSPANGTLSGIVPSLTYTPFENYNGSDSFTFEVTDGALTSSITVITININPINDVPTAQNQTLELDEDDSLTITLSGTDVDNDPLEYIILDAPENGALTGIIPDLTYEPNSDYNGSDSFTYIATDGLSTSSIAIVEITVNEINDPPIADSQSVTTDEDVAIDITLTGSDIDGDLIEYTIVNSPEHGTLAGAIPDLTYTPDENYHGDDSFSFEVTDGSLTSSLAQISITIESINDVPEADSQTLTTDEDNPINIILTGSDLDGDTISFEVLESPSNGILSGLVPNLTYTPNQDYNGSDSFTFVVSDSVSTSTLATIDLTITSINDTPVANNQTIETDEDNSLVILLAASDVDGDVVQYEFTSQPANGVLTGVAPNLTYTPNENYNGSDGFTFEVSDGQATSITADVSITINPVNDIPEADSQSVTTDEDIGINLTLTGFDVDGDALEFIIINMANNGSLSGTAPNLSYTPNENYFGNDEFTFVTTDGSATSTPAVVSITINSINDIPVADAQSVTTDEDTSIDISLTGSDADGDPLSFAVINATVNGTIIEDLPDLTYTPDENFYGTDSLSFEVTDGVATSTAIITITINSVNDAPVVDAGIDYLIDVGNAVELTGVVLDDDTPIGSILSCVWSKVSGPGDVTFADETNQETTAEFSAAGIYILSLTADDTELSSNDEVEISVNDVPVVNAGDDQIITYPNQATLTGTITDDGLPYSETVQSSWNKVSGPGNVLFDQAEQANTTVRFSEIGDYVLRLNASDSRLLAGDELTVSVRPEGPNTAPVVDAGQDKEIGFVNTIVLDGSVSDDSLPWGEALIITWSQVSGPNSLIFTDTSDLDTSVEFSESGTYVLKLSVSDSELTTEDDVTITVFADNLPPVVNAGLDQNIESTTAELTGQITDDGLPIETIDVTWSQESGPGSVTFANQDQVNTAISFTQSGTYTLRLTATDSEYSTFDEVQVTVAANQPPQVNAGQDIILDLTVADTPAGPNPPAIQPHIDDDWEYSVAKPGVTNKPPGSSGVYIIRDSISVSGDDVYVAGIFNYINGIEVNGIAKWDGCSFSPLYDPRLIDPSDTNSEPIGLVRYPRHATMGPLAARVDQLFVAGSLKDLNNNNFLEHTARWTGSGWESWGYRTVTPGVGDVWEIEAGTNAVYVGGLFNFQPVDITNGPGGGVPLPGIPVSHRIAKWTPENGWEALGEGIVDTNSSSHGAVGAIAEGPNGEVYVGGRFVMETPSGLANNIAVWDGSEWAPMGDGVRRAVSTVEVQDIQLDENGDIYVGGCFDTAGGIPANNIAKVVFDTNTSEWVWSALGEGVNNTVEALEFRNGVLFVGGSYFHAGGQIARCIARWDGAQWGLLDTGLSVGFNSRVFALGNARDGMYIGGMFTEAGGEPAIGIAKWGVPPQPTLGCPDNVVVNGAPDTGAEVVLTALPGHPCGKELTITWNVDGGPAEFVQVLAEGTTAPEIANNFTNHYLPGIHNVTVTLEDGVTPALECSCVVSILTPAMAVLNGEVLDDGLPSGTLVSAWTLIDGPVSADIQCPECPLTTASFTETGTYILQLSGDDSEYQKTDTMTVFVREQGALNQPPSVNAGMNQTIILGNNVSLNGVVSDDGLPAGSTLAVNWTTVSGPGTVTFSDSTTPVTTASFDQEGTYVLRLIADDSEFSYSDDIVITVEQDLNTAPTVEAGNDLYVLLQNTPEGLLCSVDLTTDTADDGLPYGILNEQWSKVDGPGNVLFKNVDGEYAAQFNTAGIYTLRLTADDGPLDAYDDVTVTVFDPVNEPVIEITSPLDTDVITAPTPIIATVDSSILASYELQYRTQDSALDENDGWLTVTSGTSAVSGQICEFDPTLLLNGSYEMRLIATDLAGRETITDPVTVTVDGNMKVGNFSIAFNDLSVSLVGIPIEILRAYDTRDKRMGDFGPGWTLALKDLHLQKNRPLGSHWHQEITGFVSSLGIPIYEMTSYRDRIVTITMPDNEVFRFKAVFSPERQSAVPIMSGNVVFEPLPGTHGTLETVAQSTVRVSGAVPYYDPMSGGGLSSGFVDLEKLDYTGGFEPQLFRFTTAEGTTYIIHEDDGVQKVIDLYGNEVTYTENGIFHSCGKSVQFIRNADGCISQIIDPAGNTVNYLYNTNGLLEDVVDQTTNTTTFTYEEALSLLEDIIDPRGVRAIRCIYDDAGRMVKQVDADGNEIEMIHDIANRRETIKDRLGFETIHEYDDCGNVLRTIDALGLETTYTYDTFDNQLSKVDPLGHITTWTYDANDNQTSETDSIGNTSYTTYNVNNALTSMTDERGNTNLFHYNQYGALTNMTDAAGNVTTFVYDYSGNMIAQIDALGNVTSNKYDTQGNMIEEVTALGVKTTYTYDPNGNQTSWSTTRTTPGGSEIVTVSNIYDSANRLVKVINPDSTFTETQFNEAGKETVKIDELGRMTETVYNARGDVVRTIYPDGSDISVGYDLEGRKVAETNQLGFVTQYVYDPLGRLTHTIHSDGAIEESILDEGGRIIQSIDALGNITSYGYEEGCACAGRQSTVTNALSQVTDFEYDEVGNMLSMADANGNVTTDEYDSLNRRTKTIFPDTTFVTTEYDLLGRMVSKTDQAGISTWYEYNSLNRLIAVSNIMGHVTRYVYDEVGNQTAQIDANGHITLYEYDNRGRRIKRTLPEGQVETYSYDAVGNMTNKVDFNGNTITYEYDTMNRLLAKNGEVPVPTTVSYTYNDRGNRTSMTDSQGITTYLYDERDRLLQKATPIGALNYTYDLHGNLLTIKSSNVNGTDLVYQYDELNRLRNAINPTTGLTQYNYDNVGNLRSFIYPNGVNTFYDYDNLNRLTNMAINRLTTPIESYAYTLASTGHRLGVQEGNGRNVSYEYDNIYRLTKESILGASILGNIDYNLDPVGNRLTMDSTVLGIPSQVNTFDENDLLDSNTSDSNGNTTEADGKIFEYDFENRIKSMTSASKNVEIEYDGDGNRVKKSVDGIETYYLVDTENLTGYAQVMEELNIIDSQPAVSRVYSYGLDLISQEQLHDTPTGTVWQACFYGYDGHGNVRFLTDLDGFIKDRYDFDAYGNIIAQSGSTANNYLYCGEQLDQDIGLYFLRARYMDTVRGRFWTMDIYEGIIFDPNRLHKYLYCNNNPILFIDPSGNYSLIHLAGATTLMAAIWLYYTIPQIQLWITNTEDPAIYGVTPIPGLHISFYGLAYEQLTPLGKSIIRIHEEVHQSGVRSEVEAHKETIRAILPHLSGTSLSLNERDDLENLLWSSIWYTSNEPDWPYWKKYILSNVPDFPINYL